LDVFDVERETKLKMEADQEVGLWLACRRETPKSSLRATRLPKFFDLESINSINNQPDKLSRMAESTDTELMERFSPSGTELEADVLAELHSIMRLHSIDVQELWYKWESYSMKMGSDDMKLDIETARALKKDIQDSLEQKSRSKAHVLQSNKRAGATPRTVTKNDDVFGM
jgi:hypothetical protein